MKMNAYAKINLTLNILNKRKDGYHNLKSVMLPIDLFDVIEITKSEDFCINSEIDNNIITKVFNIFKERYNIGNVSVNLVKNIPLQAGLGGGSADATAAIKIFNDLFELDLPLIELEKIALEVGSDTLFTLHNKPAIISSRGDEIEFLDGSPDFYILLIKPEFGVSTKEAFSNIKEYNLRHNDDIINSLKNNDIKMINLLCYNSFLDSLLHHNNFKVIYEELSLLKTTHLSGSGSTLFMISSQKEELLNIERKISGCYTKIVKPFCE